ncbi:MAG TPA: metallophosphoesterase [Myxococcales bacterium]|jgi:UDP-2,3-diacylglucosamine pyrophosphatase LpxH
MLYVLSDLHLDERGEPRMFADERQGRALKALCERIANDEEGELVLLGDTFDFTSMVPPDYGLERFFRRLDVPLEPKPKRTLFELLHAVQESNPVTFDALQTLGKKRKITIVAGNHDHQIRQVRDVGFQAEIVESCERTIGEKRLVLQHGHEQDPGNREPGGSGEQMTRCVHQGVIPYLLHHGARRNVRMDVGRIVALRPEEATISVLQRWLDEPTFKKFFRAFVDLLADNGYLPKPVTFLAKMISVNRVRAAVAKADLTWEHTGSFAIELLQGKRKLPHGARNPDVLVFGHTHVLDWAAEDDKLYVNLGTWTERALDGNSPQDRTLPLLTFSAPEGRLQAKLDDLESGLELQRYNQPG